MERLTWRICLETALKCNGETYDDILHASPPLANSERWDQEFIASPIEEAIKNTVLTVTVWTPDHIYHSALCPHTGYALGEIKRDPLLVQAKESELIR